LDSTFATIFSLAAAVLAGVGLERRRARRSAPGMPPPAGGGDVPNRGIVTKRRQPAAELSLALAMARTAAPGSVFGDATAVRVYVEAALALVTPHHPWLEAVAFPSREPNSEILGWLLRPYSPRFDDVELFYRLDARVREREFVIWFGHESGFFTRSIEEWVRPAVHYDFEMYGPHLEPRAPDGPINDPGPAALAYVLDGILRREPDPESAASPCVSR